MKIKSIYKPIYTQNKIFFGTESSRVEINDVTEKQKLLINLLEKGISQEELLTNFGYDLSIANEIIDALNEYGILEDEILENPKDEIEYLKRYKNNLNYFKNYSTLDTTAISIQKLLNSKKILLIGVGGASILASTFVGMGIENLILLDYDIIELSNLNRQFIFTEKSIGKLKVNEARRYLTQLNSRSKIKVINKKVENYKDILKLVKESDIVINAIDTPPIEANRWVNYCCSLYKRPLFQMGMGISSIIIEKFLYKHGCYDCSLITQLENDFEETKAALDLIYSSEYKTVNSSFAPNILVGTGILAMEVFNYIVNENDDSDISIEIDLNTYQLKKINLHNKVEYCPTCGYKREFITINKLIEMVSEKNGYK